MKKNKIIKITVVFVIFLLLLVVYLALKNHNKEAKQQTEETGENTIVSVDADEIKELTFKIAGAEQTFVKDKENWSLRSDSNFPVNAKQMKVLTDALTDVKATRTLEETENLAEYGLEDAKNTIKVKKTDGSEVAIAVGITNTTIGGCYVYVNDDKDKIYMVDSDFATVFEGSLLNYAVETAYPTIVGSNISDIQVKEEGNAYHLQRDTSSSTGWIVTDETGEINIGDSEVVATLQSAIAGFTFTNYYDYDCKDLSQYGLDNPYAVITARYSVEAETAQEDPETTEASQSTKDKEAKVETVKIAIGNEDGNGNRYVCVNDGTEVHAIATESLSAVLDEGNTEDTTAAVTSIAASDLESMDITIDGQTHTLKAETSEDDTSTTKYYLDGAEMESADYLDFYSRVTAMTSQGEVDKHEEIVGNPELTVVYHQTDGTVTEISYIAYDNNFYMAVSPTLEKQYLVNKMKVKDVMETAKKLFK